MASERFPLAKLFLPLFLIPLTLYGVVSFGHVAGDAIIGAAFFISLVKFANKNERRFMIILAVFSILFETANVALGLYAYSNVVAVPAWVGLGWGIVGIYLLRNAETFKKLSNGHAYALAACFYIAIWAFTSNFSPSALVPALFAVAAVYVLSLASSLPASFFLASGAIGVIIEFSGTTLKVWQYFNEAAEPIAPGFAALAIAYSSVMGFALWVSGVEKS